VAISGPSFQNVADSMRLTSRTTSHFRLARPLALHLGLRRADGRVLPDEEVALDLAVDLVHDGLVGAVVAGELGQQVEAEVVLRRGGVAVPGLEQVDRVGVGRRPEALHAGPGDRREVVLQAVVLPATGIGR
jgi:hypothetical protein